MKRSISKKSIAAKLLQMGMTIHYIKNDKIIGWSMITGTVQTILFKSTKIYLILLGQLSVVRVVLYDSVPIPWFVFESSPEVV